MSRIRFHLDESVSTALAVGLRHHGIEVTTTAEVGLRKALDEEQLAFATTEGRVLITHDQDFLSLGSVPPHTGIVYCHQDKYALGALIRHLTSFWNRHSPDEMVNSVEFL